MKSLLERNKMGLTWVTIGIVGFALTCFFIWLFTLKPQIPPKYKHALDSLSRVNANLLAKQKQLDSAIATHQARIQGLDKAIGEIEVQKTEIHNHYQVLGGKAGKYTPTQVDSFLKARYGY